MSSHFNEIMSYLRTRRERAISGKYNCIPWPFRRFRSIFPGTEMGRFIIVTANQKIGKTKFCDFVYVYETLFFILEHPEIRVKILYFTLEEAAKNKHLEFQCHLLYKLDGIAMSPAELASTDIDKPVPEEVLKLLESERYQKYIRKFEEMVEFIDDEKNPTGINKKCREYAMEHGKLNLIDIETKDPLGKAVMRKKVNTINPYTPDDPEEYRIVIIDNASNLTLESGMNKTQTIEKLAKYAITLRNQLNYTVVLIQHQAQAQEGIENFKLNKLKPSSDGLADCKTTTRDIDVLIGLYSPFKHGIESYEGYDITKFKNHIRFMEILEDRHYGANGNICPLYFDGAVSSFAELPNPKDTVGMQKVYKFLEENKTKKKGLFTLLSFNTIKKLFNK